MNQTVTNLKQITFAILLAICCIPTFGQSIMDSLILYYPNGDAIDASGNGLNGTLYGPQAITDRHGEINGALFFNGQNDYIELPADTILKPPFPITVSLWVKLETLEFDNTSFFGNDHEPNDYNGVWLQTTPSDDGTISASYGGGGGNTGTGNRKSKFSDTTLDTGQWQHIVAVFNGIDSIEIYIDGLNAGGYYDGGLQTDMEYSSYAGVVGLRHVNTSSSAKYYWGAMDELAVWSRALSATEVAQLNLTPIGIENSKDYPDNSSLRLYPNPASNSVTIEFTNPNFSQNVICVYDMTGKLLRMSTMGNTNKFTLPTHDLDAGLYLIRVVGEKGQTAQRTVVIN